MRTIGAGAVGMAAALLVGACAAAPNQPSVDVSRDLARYFNPELPAVTAAARAGCTDFVSTATQDRQTLAVDGGDCILGGHRLHIATFLNDQGRDASLQAARRLPWGGIGKTHLVLVLGDDASTVARAVTALQQADPSVGAVR